MMTRANTLEGHMRIFKRVKRAVDRLNIAGGLSIWRLEVVVDSPVGFGCTRCTVRMFVRDRFDRVHPPKINEVVEHHDVTSLPEQERDEDDDVRLVLRAVVLRWVHDMINHEIDECLQLDGVPLNDPHDEPLPPALGILEAIRDVPVDDEVTDG